MRRAIFAMLICMAVTMPAYSDEEIQLAAAIGSSSTTSHSGAIGSGGKTTVKDEGSPNATVKSGLSTANMVGIGIVSAVGIAVVAGGGQTSASSH